jgi:hypothetical protein
MADAAPTPRSLAVASYYASLEWFRARIAAVRCVAPPPAAAPPPSRRLCVPLSLARRVVTPSLARCCRGSSEPFRVLSVDNGSPEYDADILLQLRVKFPALRLARLNGRCWWLWVGT